MIEKKMYTVSEVAQILGIHKNTAYKYVQTGQIKSVKLGSQYRIPSETVQEIIKNGIR